jgi:uncharacterized protein
VSSLSTDEWEPDPDVGGEIHLLGTGVSIEAGLWRYTTVQLKPIEYTLHERKTLLVLEGEARIELADGPTLVVKTGDIASWPKGGHTTWHLTTPYREFFTFG